MTKQIKVRGIAMGGGAPVSIQSMCNTRTDDVEKTVRQTRELVAAGCGIVRLAVPDKDAAKALSAIRKAVPDVPLVADIHFDYRLALAAAAAGSTKSASTRKHRGARARARRRECLPRARHPHPHRVNGGSLEKDMLAKYGGVTAEALVESAINEIALLERFDFTDICVSIKSSHVPVMIRAYRLMAERSEYPLHLGVTEAGTPAMGIVKSAMGSVRSFATASGHDPRLPLGRPVEEVAAAKRILRAAGLRKDGPEIISCPTCGRTRIDLIALAEEVERRLEGCTKPITVAVMGCVVNGPGEARSADVGIAGGDGMGMLFRKGEQVRVVPQAELVDALMELIDEI
jgi:(E)-4-hydroxy-3-methylbut-2-enyl-diphosphate synthase